MRQVATQVPRLLPSVDLPGYTYTTGQGLPHPYRDPKGHSHGKKNRTVKPLIANRWAESPAYLLALDRFNHGFYWEAHDEWERLTRVSNPEALVGRFLKGLVKMAAAGLKVREQSVHGVRRHAASAGEVFADVARGVRRGPLLRAGTDDLAVRRGPGRAAVLQAGTALRRGPAGLPVPADARTAAAGLSGAAYEPGAQAPAVLHRRSWL